MKIFVWHITGCYLEVNCKNFLALVLCYEPLTWLEDMDGGWQIIHIIEAKPISVTAGTIIGIIIMLLNVVSTIFWEAISMPLMAAVLP